MPLKKKPGSKTAKKQAVSKTAKVKEIWRPCPIKEFSSKYYISNLGRVKNINTGHILKHCIRAGYKSHFYVSGAVKKAYKVHRMVAMTFIPNDDPEKKIWVNHINHDKMDCRAENLEWITPKGNIQDAVDNGLITITKRRVGRFNVDTLDFIDEFESLDAAKQATGIDDGTIAKVCKLRGESAGGFYWIFLDENPNEQVDVDLSEFKQIDDFPNHWVNNEGKVYSVPYKKFMTLYERDGSQTVQLAYRGVKKDFSVHRLVAQYFLKKDNKKYNSIKHIDGNKLNNNVNNLKWAYVPGVEKLESKRKFTKTPKKKQIKKKPIKKLAIVTDDELDDESDNEPVNEPVRRSIKDSMKKFTKKISSKSNEENYEANK